MELGEYIKMQLCERYRCFILCGAGLTGKSKRIKQEADHFGGRYIDVLDYFYENTDLSVELTRPEQFFRLFNLEEKQLIVFDNLDFLFCMWTENQQREFIRKLDMKSNGSCIVAVMHNYKLLEEYCLMKKNSRGQKRIINIVDFM